MFDALEAHCSSLSSEQWLFDNEDYSFCKCKDDQCHVDIYGGDYDVETQKKRRAAAEYHYMQTYLKNEKLAGKCGKSCMEIKCTNGRIDVGEVCDGKKDALTGNDLPDGFVCAKDCRSTQVCGNGVINDGEICDPPTDGCIECIRGQTCGNGILDPDEQCDDFRLSEDDKNNGYCVITSSKELDGTWVRASYASAENAPTNASDCAAEKGEWTGEECLVLDKCIKESVHSKCLIPKNSADCNNSERLVDCYTFDKDAQIIEDEMSCQGVGGEWMNVCIFKKCALATCGDGYVFSENGVENCDHGQGAVESQEDLEKKIEATCSSVCTDENNSQSCSECMKGLDFTCNYNCKSNECGDGILNKMEGEECDWGQQHNGKSKCPGGEINCQVCSGECKFVTLGCGNGEIDTIDTIVHEDGTEEVKKEACDFAEEKNGVKTYVGATAEACGDDKYPCRICENNCMAEKTYYKVDVSSIKGQGTILSESIGINCSTKSNVASVCSTYTTTIATEDTPVVFKANPSEGWEIIDWGLSEDDTPCTVVSEDKRTLSCKSLIQGENAPLTMSPVFVKARYQVSASVEGPTGAGTVSATCTPETCVCVPTGETNTTTCTGENTDQVTFTAQPTTADYVFVKWENGCPVVTNNPDGSSTCSGAVGTGWDISAIFAKQYLVTYSVEENNREWGSVSSTIDSGTRVNNGTSVTLIAAPNSTYKFTGWTLTAGYTCQDENDKPKNPCTLTVSGKDLDAKASFDQAPAIITAESFVVDKAESAHLSGINFCITNSEASCTECTQPEETETEQIPQKFDVVYGSSYKVCYTKNPNFDNDVYRYAYWTGCSDYDETSCTIPEVVNTSNPVKLVFSKNKHNLHFGITGLNANDELSFTCSGEVTSGTKCDSLFEHGEIVTIALDKENSTCSSDKKISLKVLSDNISAEYICECPETETQSVRRYGNCHREGEETNTEANLNVTMTSDKTVSVSLINKNNFILSSAKQGNSKDQLKGSVIGSVNGQISFYCQSSNCNSIEVARNANVTLSAESATGYQLTAWRINDQYLSALNEKYTIGSDLSSISFVMTEQIDVTPVFMPILTATVSPEAGGTLQCSLSCSSINDNDNCKLPAIDVENSLYLGYEHTVPCSETAETTCQLASCSGAFSNKASISINGTAAAGYSFFGWSVENASCSGNTCTISDMNEPLTVTLYASQNTGSLIWGQGTNASEAEFASFKYHKAELKERWQWPRYRYESSEESSNDWSVGDYYLVAVPVGNSDKTIQLICPENSVYRCVDGSNSLGFSLDWSQNKNKALSDLRALFTETTGKCSSAENRYVQCLFVYGENSQVTVTYEDITHALSVECDEGRLTLQGEWVNSNQSTTEQLSLDCKETQSVAQNAQVKLEVSNLTEGYRLKEWKLNGSSVDACANHTTCEFVMPSAATEIEPVVEKTPHALTVQAFPNGSTGTFKCAIYSENACGEYGTCSSSYDHGAVLCVQASPTSGYDFLDLMNGSGCPGTNWARDAEGNGICANVVMTEDRTVSAVFTENPEILFNSNQSACTISCTSPNCTPTSNGTVSVASGGSAAFTAPIECSGGYEFLSANNQRNCPVASDAWTISGNTATCSLANVISAVNYVYAVYTKKPTLTQALGSAGGSLVACEGESTMNVGTTSHATGTEVEVCAKPDDSHYSIEATGCPGSGWSLIENSDIYKCTVTMNGDQTVIASFVHDSSQVVNVSQIGQGLLDCQTTAETNCPASGYARACSSSEVIPKNQKLCIKATGDNAAHTEPSACQGGTWSNGVCTVSYDGTNTKQATMVFSTMPKVTMTKSENLTWVSCEAGYQAANLASPAYYPSQTPVAICVKAASGYEINTTMGCNLQAWTQEATPNDGTVYKCDLGNIDSDKIVSANEVALSGIAVSMIGIGEIQCKYESRRECDDASNYETCQSTYNLKSNERLCVRTIVGADPFNQGTSICPGGAWQWTDNSSGFYYCRTTTQGTVKAVFTSNPMLTYSTECNNGEQSCGTLSVNGGHESGERIAANTSLVLTATPAENYELLGVYNTSCPANGGWVPNGSGDYTCSWLMGTSDTTIGVLFTKKPQLTVNLAPSAGGQVVDCVNGSAMTLPSHYPTGALANVCVQAIEGYEFNSSFGCKGGAWTPVEGLSKVFKCENIEMNGNQSVYAGFATMSTVSVQKEGNGTQQCAITSAENCNSIPDAGQTNGWETCNSSYILESGESLCVKGTAAENAELLSSNVSCAENPGNYADSICRVPYSASAKTVNMTFTTKPYLSLTMLPNASAGEVVKCAEAEEAMSPGYKDTSAELIDVCVQAKSGYSFGETSIGCPNANGWQVVDENRKNKFKCSFAMTENRSVYALFDAVATPTNTVTVTKLGNGTLKCQTSSESACPAKGEGNYALACGGSYSLSSGQKLCVLAEGDGSAHTELNTAQSLCPGSSNSFNENGICSVSYAATGAQSVVATFTTKPQVTATIEGESAGGQLVACPGSQVAFSGPAYYPSGNNSVEICVSAVSGYELVEDMGCPGSGWTETETTGTYQCSLTNITSDQTVTAYFDALAAFNVNVNSPEGVVYRSYTVAKTNCSSVGTTFDSLELLKDYPVGTSLCVKAMENDDVNHSSLVIGNECLWIPQSGNDGAYYLCDVTVDEGGTTLTLTATPWPTLTVTDGVTGAYEIAEGTCDDPSSFSSSETNSFQLVPGSQRCIKATEIENYTFTNSSGCPTGNEYAWSSYGESPNNFIGCSITLAEDVSVVLSYTPSGE